MDELCQSPTVTMPHAQKRPGVTHRAANLMVQPEGALMASLDVMNETELRISGIEALNKALGPAAALRFLTLLHHEPTDYVEISQRLYEGQTVDEIFERAKQNWRG